MKEDIGTVEEFAKLKAENERLTNESNAYEQAKKELKQILEVENER